MVGRPVVDLLRAGDDVPGRSGGISLYANEGVAQVHDAGRSDRYVWVLDRLVGGVGDLRQPHRGPDLGAVVLEYVVDSVGRGRAPAAVNFIAIERHRGVGFNVFGVRPLKGFTYVTRGADDDLVASSSFGPLVRALASHNVHGRSPAISGAASRSRLCGCSSWPGRRGVEVCATFTPEYKTQARYARSRCEAPRILARVVHPAAARARWLTGIPSSPRSSTTTYVTTVSDDRRHRSTRFPDRCLIRAFVLSMATSTADGRRALYGISKAGLTIKWLGKLNRCHVPGNAMTVDLVVNTCLLVCSSPATWRFCT